MALDWCGDAGLWASEASESVLLEPVLGGPPKISSEKIHESSSFSVPYSPAVLLRFSAGEEHRCENAVSERGAHAYGGGYAGPVRKVQP